MTHMTSKTYHINRITSTFRSGTPVIPVSENSPSDHVLSFLILPPLWLYRKHAPIVFQHLWQIPYWTCAQFLLPSFFGLFETNFDNILKGTSVWGEDCMKHSWNDWWPAERVKRKQFHRPQRRCENKIFICYSFPKDFTSEVILLIKTSIIGNTEFVIYGIEDHMSGKQLLRCSTNLIG